MMLPLSTGRIRLTWLWGLGCLPLVILLFAQSVGGGYCIERNEAGSCITGSQIQDAWKWLLPHLSTLSLIVGIWVADVTGNAVDGKSVSRFLFWLTFVCSAIYLLALLSTMFFLPLALSFNEGMEALEWLQLSDNWLLFLQGLSTATMGVFFIKTT